MLKLSENPPQLNDGIDTLTDLDGEWWVAHTKARFEKALAWQLLGFSVPYFLPMIGRTTLSGGRKRKVLIPLFTSYVFFCGDADVRQRVLSTNRVCQVIPVRQREQLVSELEGIRIALQQNLQLNLYPFAAMGRRCRVAKGAMRGMEGVVVQDNDITRLVLQVSMLGQGASLEISADLLEPAD